MQTNDTIEVRIRVSEKDLASSLPISSEDRFPPVYATSKMIGLMEIAAARLMQKDLKEGELSVGVGIDVKHIAATPVNKEVSARATFLQKSSKLYKFKIEAYDEGGKIGEGQHTRAIVSEQRLVAGAHKRFH